MKKILRRLAALGLCAGVLVTSALALTPQELGTILRSEYAGEIPRQVWEQDTVEGMMAALGDPFSHYYTAEEYRRYQSGMSETGSAGATAQVTMEDGHIGRILLRSFGADTYELLKAGMEQCAQADRWVVDLRENRGGELKAAVDAMSAFAGSGQLVYLRDKDGKLLGARTTHGKLTLQAAIILVGEKTASAGELYAAALRDRQKGLVIGQRTYGKGVAQSAFDRESPTYASSFADGSALVLTTHRVFSETMTSNNIIGVIPHLVVAEDLAERVAKLLCQSAPTGDTAGYLRLHLARWRWYVKLSQAKADLPAFQALLEALPPQAELYEGTGGPDGWRETTPAAVAADQKVSGYTPRTFPDVSDSPYADAINALKTYGIVKGNEKGHFDPGQSLTRASLCALLAQAMDYPMSQSAPAFADTPAEAWYTPYVTTLSAMGIVNGYSDGLFHPDDPIPHQQFMTILARVVAYTNHTSKATLDRGPEEKDLAAGDFAAYDAWAVPGAWLLDGAWHAPAKDIDPRGATTREEAACALWNALSILDILPA